MENELLIAIAQDIIKMGSVFSLMGLIIYWLSRKLDKREGELKELQKTIIDLQLENIEVIKELTQCVELMRKDINYMRN